MPTITKYEGDLAECDSQLEFNSNLYSSLEGFIILFV